MPVDRYLRSSSRGLSLVVTISSVYVFWDDSPNWNDNLTWQEYV